MLKLSESQTKFERLLGALILGGTADALGWRNETASKSSKRDVIDRLRPWSKRVGRIGGHWEKIEPGEYSDDTQLTLAVARCVSSDGRYDPDRFARIELPYWLRYQRGGGRTVKAAARNLAANPRLSWNNNFFERYRQAGANGVAMRVLAFAVIDDVNKMSLAVWQNALATHGHPRAIVGALAMSYGLHHILRVRSFSPSEYVKNLLDFLKDTKPEIDDDSIGKWVQKAGSERFLSVFQNTKAEMAIYLSLVNERVNLPKEDILEQLGCYRSSTKGSGTGTVAAGNYFFLRYWETPEKGVIEAANSLGTDTDTIGKFCGNLLGCLRGKEAYENRLTEDLQDRVYFLRSSNYLAGREEKEQGIHDCEETKITKLEKEGDEYQSKIFGPGIVTQLRRPRLVNRGRSVLYQVKAQFAIGITCVFSKVIPKNGFKVAERFSTPSLWK